MTNLQSKVLFIIFTITHLISLHAGIYKGNPDQHVPITIFRDMEDKQ